MKDRIRISVTLRPEIVNLLDSKIDGVQLRNRSHAIEQFLKQTLVTPISQAVILAGDQEKSLIEIGGKPVIEIMIKQLRRASIKRIVICTNKDAAKLTKFLSKKKFEDLEIIFANNAEKGTGFALSAARHHLKPENFLLLYGDVLAEIDVLDLVDFHQSHGGLATMAITSVPDPLPWGVVKLKRNRIVNFLEKPPKEARLTNLINAGAYVFQPEVFAYVVPETKSLEKEIFPLLASKNKLHAYLLDGLWFDIGMDDLLKLAQKYWGEKQ